MKKIYLIILGVFVCCPEIFGQVRNLNPDPNGEPWIAGDYIFDTSDIHTVPPLVLSNISAATPLPYKVDNSKKKYMRAIFNQGNYGSCAVASTVGYMLTYEFNRVRNLSGFWNANIMAHHFTYNYLNRAGQWNAVNDELALQIIKSDGNPNISTWGGLYGTTIYPYREWMSGYDKYLSAMDNKVEQYYLINSISDTSGLNKLKHWLSDHNEGDTVGGLATFGVLMDVGTWDSIHSGSENAGEALLVHWGNEPSSGHGLTIVGYNDSIKYDINGDGLYTNNKDINGDTIVDMKDWEIGAVKIANSYGKIWPNFIYGVNPTGYTWALYSSLTDLWVGHQYAMVAKVKAHTTPQLTYKVKMHYQTRKRMSISGLAATHANSPGWNTSCEFKGVSCHQGGVVQLNGVDTNAVEFGFDATALVSSGQYGKYALKIHDSIIPNVSHGLVHDFSLIDYRFGEVFEVPCNQHNVIITMGGDTYLTIDYDLLPFTMAATYNINTNRFARKTISIEEPVTITNNARIDFYNSNMIVENKGALGINTGQLMGVSGNNTLDVFGNLLISNAVSIKKININIKAGGTLTINKNAILTIDSLGNITVEPGGNLIVQKDVAIHFAGANGKMVISGNATFDINTSFSAPSIISGNYIKFSNNSLNYTISHCNFNNITIYGPAKNIALQYCQFTNVFVKYQGGTGFIYQNNVAVNTSLSITQPGSKSAKISITNCSFINGSENSHAVINIDAYPLFEISDNIIENNMADGITLFNSGTSFDELKKIKNNRISNNKIGLLIYQTYVVLENNCINGNFLGIVASHNSNVKMLGTREARYVNQTQRIFDNTKNQFYATDNSFPYFFKWNAVFGASTPYIQYYGRPTTEFDVTYNYWGNDYNPEAIFSPFSAFTYLPDWFLINSEYDERAPELLFKNAKTLINENQYMAAETILHQIVSAYPNDDYAQVSLKEMLALKTVSDTDFIALKQYYVTDPVINSNPGLSKLSGYLANNCDIKAGNYDEAVLWLTSVLENPPTFDDSVFAAIDLSKLYLLMDDPTNSRTQLVVAHPDLQTRSYAEYSIKRKQLIDLLLDFKGSNQKPENTILQNSSLRCYPNPMEDNAIIELFLPKAGNVKIKIYDIYSREIISLTNKYYEKGNFRIFLNSQELNSNIYFCVLYVDGIMTDTQKLVKIK